MESEQPQEHRDALRVLKNIVLIIFNSLVSDFPASEPTGCTFWDKFQIWTAIITICQVHVSPFTPLHFQNTSKQPVLRQLKEWLTSNPSLSFSFQKQKCVTFLSQNSSGFTTQTSDTSAGITFWNSIVSVRPEPCKHRSLTVWRILTSHNDTDLISWVWSTYTLCPRVFKVNVQHHSIYTDVCVAEKENSLVLHFYWLSLYVVIMRWWWYIFLKQTCNLRL